MGITCIDDIPLDERIITVENAREYELRHRNKVHLILAYPVDADTDQDQFPHEPGLTALVFRPAARDVIF
jgi:hypothetical protein